MIWDFLLKNWIKLPLSYLGSSKKHKIFRAKRWTRDFEKIIKKPVFNQEYKKVGHVKDIFGPVQMPFISIKTLPDVEFNPNDIFYAKTS